jgi:predicted outer membrane repeat protein
MKLKTINPSTLIKIVIFSLGLLLIGWELAPGIQAANLRAQAECGPNGVGASAALRAAINQANQPGAAAEIQLSPNCIYELDNQFINGPFDGATNLPYLTRDLTIIGNGATLRRPVTAPLYRMLVIEARVSVTMTNVTLENGQEGPSGFGGAIRLKQDASLTLENVNFKNNRTRFGGGAIYANPGQLIINGGLFENNRVKLEGGGAIVGFGDITISDAKFTDNQAADAGALLLSGGITIDHNEFLKNKALTGNGGAVHISGITTDVFLTRNKFFQNQAFTGGGAFIRDPCPNPLPTLGHVHIYNNLWVNQIAPDTAHLFVRLVGNNTKSFSVHYNTFIGALTPTEDSTGVALRQDSSNQAAVLPALIFNNIFIGHHVALENGGTL